jgi:hypothetical protein
MLRASARQRATRRFEQPLSYGRSQSRAAVHDFRHTLDLEMPSPARGSDAAAQPVPAACRLLRGWTAQDNRASRIVNAAADPRIAFSNGIASSKGGVAPCALRKHPHLPLTQFRHAAEPLAHAHRPGEGHDAHAELTLAELGSVRERFDSDEHLAAEAGVAPVNYASRKSQAVRFRWACNHRLRAALTCMADNSRHANAWAASVYAKARARGCDHPLAVHVLSRAWLRVIWRAWTDRILYDPEQHRGAQLVLKTAGG